MTNPDHSIVWQYGLFNRLSSLQVHAILQQRQKVFVLEQQCLYPDIDNTDLLAGHLIGWLEHGKADLEIAGYLRIMAPGVCYPEVSVGRVLIVEKMRGNGMGLELMNRALTVIAEIYPNVNIRISAQHYLEKFYTGLGFVTLSDAYDEDGIPHIDMLLDAGQLRKNSFAVTTQIL